MLEIKLKMSCIFRVRTMSKEAIYRRRKRSNSCLQRGLVRLPRKKGKLGTITQFWLLIARITSSRTGYVIFKISNIEIYMQISW